VAVKENVYEDEEFLELEDNKPLESRKAVEEGVYEDEEERVIEINGKLIALIAVAGIVIVSLLVFFVFFGAQAPPDVKIKSEQTGDTLYLYHEGGDALLQKPLHAYVGSEELPASRITLLSADWPWSIGNIVKVDFSGYMLPALFRMTYMPGNEEYTILTTTLSAPPTPEPTPVPTPIPTPEPTPEPTIQQLPIFPQPGQTLQPLTQEDIAALSGTKVDFQAFPTYGMSPLYVQFGDISNGCYMSRTWDFGDGFTSSEPYPNHTYPFPGAYSISLSITCTKDDAPCTLLKPDYITVAGLQRQNMIISGDRTALLQPGGKIYFTVAGPKATIKIGGKEYYFNKGDEIELVIGNDGTGTLAIVPGVITDCGFDDVSLYCNNEFITRGVLKSILIGTYEKLETSKITVVIPPAAAELKGIIPEIEDISGHAWEELILSDIGIDDMGQLQLITNYPYWFSFRGAVEQYQFNRIPQYS